MDFDYRPRYTSRRTPVFGRDVAATSHPLAAQAGLKMMQSGGNAVDAAVAMAACMTVVEPCSNGLGSDLFAIVWDGSQLLGLNASGHAPAAWNPAYFTSKYGAQMPRRGVDAVTVPGAVSGWVALHGRLGRLPFADVLAPAIELAERGYAVPVVVQEKWALAAGVEELTRQPGFAETFLPKGRAPQVGEHFAMPAAARTLREIARSNAEAFYCGEVAQAIAAHVQAHGGALSASDLAAYAPEWVTPLAQNYRDHTLHEIPPNGQGIAAQMAAGILEHLNIGEHAVDSIQSCHLQIEAMKLAFADVYRHVSDSRTMRITPAQMLDPAYLAERARLVDRRRAQDFKAGDLPRGGTIYLTAADRSGRMVSLIQSNYMGFGSGVVVPGWGISLQNRGHGFTLDETSANVVAPHKRPFHTIIPAFLTRDGQPMMSFGVMGGHMQPQGHLQTLVRMLDYGQNPQMACDGPRWRVNGGLSVNVEPHMPAATVEGLAALGHQLEGLNDTYMDFGAGQYIWRLGDPAVEGYVAASDPRRDGAAVAW
ncbi:MAG: gamma-glutamyltransferase family protein [Betaproteobacteria bacterium]